MLSSYPEKVGIGESDSSGLLCIYPEHIFKTAEHFSFSNKCDIYSNLGK